eukprot:m.47342 g.47342  ORF g.47342 m.47342 type:complete len:351 (+) comp5969_c0_seq2:40-1092(+)
MGFVAGVAVVVLGGLLSGLFTAPIKLVRGWQFENIWFVYSIYGMVLLPWILVSFSVPGFADIYSAVSTKTLVLTILFGFLWGCGSVMFGLGTAIVGNSLGFSLILGMTSAIGAALPLVALHPDEAGSKVGIFTWIGLVIVGGGLYCLAHSGSLKEEEIRERSLLGSQRAINEDSEKKGSFKFGLVICALSGIFSPMLNIALSFGSDIGDTAKDQGVSDLNSNNTIWALAVVGGFVANSVYCCYLLFKNKTWACYGQDTLGVRLRNTLLGVLMGVLWFGGNTLYGIGVSLIGDLGTVIGWPMFLSAMIVAANVFAIATGEWRGISRTPVLWTVAGLFLQIVAVVVISIGSI